MALVGSLNGKVAIVTGASRGIGQAIAVELARAGADVALLARSTDEHPNRNFAGTIDETARLVEDLGRRALQLRGDVADEQDVFAAAERTFAEFERCDVVVNNAAMSYLAPFLDLSVKRWDVVMGVNLRGPMLMCKAFLPRMIELGSGHVINISSADGRLDPESIAQAAAEVGYSGQESIFGDDTVELEASALAYGTSKAALNRFSTGLALEMRRHGIAVNALEVTAVTQAVRAAMPDIDHSQNELPEVPGQVVAWLAGQPAELTGEILVQSELVRRLRDQDVLRPRESP